MWYYRRSDPVPPHAMRSLALAERDLECQRRKHAQEAPLRITLRRIRELLNQEEGS